MLFGPISCHTLACLFLLFCFCLRIPLVSGNRECEVVSNWALYYYETAAVKTCFFVKGRYNDGGTDGT